MESVVLHGRVGIGHSGLAQQDTVGTGVSQLLAALCSGKGSGDPVRSCGGGDAAAGSRGSAHSASQSGVLGCPQHLGTALWGDLPCPPWEGCSLPCGWAARARRSERVGYIQEEGGSRLSWLMVGPQGTRAHSASAILPALGQS